MCRRKPQPTCQPPPPIPRPETEADLLRRAFGLIQRRITEHLAGYYPDARWVWETPNPQAHIAEGEPVHILLNRAGGYQRAEVRIHQLQFRGLKFCTLEQPEEPLPPEPDNTDFSFLAYEWVEAHLALLNECIEGKTELHLEADELPDPASWPEICAELMRNGFGEAVVTATGITLKIPE
jgi:hypothetical protein